MDISLNEGVAKCFPPLEEGELTIKWREYLKRQFNIKWSKAEKSWYISEDKLEIFNKHIVDLHDVEILESKWSDKIDYFGLRRKYCAEFDKEESVWLVPKIHKNEVSRILYDIPLTDGVFYNYDSDPGSLTHELQSILQEGAKHQAKNPGDLVEVSAFGHIFKWKVSELCEPWGVVANAPILRGLPSVEQLGFWPDDDIRYCFADLAIVQEGRLIYLFISKSWNHLYKRFSNSLNPKESFSDFLMLKKERKIIPMK